MNNYIVIVNGEEVSLKRSDIEALDFITLSNSQFHLLEKNQAHKIKMLSSDFLNKNLSLSVNGNDYTLEIRDEYDQQVKKMGLLAVTAQKINSIKAPMPGLIVEVMVEEGQEISEGTPLLVLSAMKMENIILAQGEGVVKSIEVNKDDTVEKGQLIIEME